MNGPDLRLNFFTDTGMRTSVQCCIYVPTNNLSHTLKTAKQKWVWPMGTGMEETTSAAFTLNYHFECVIFRCPCVHWYIFSTSSYPGWIKSPHVVTCHTYFPIGKICHNFIFWGGEYSANEKSKCQDLPKYQFLGGWYSPTEKSQSAKICLNFIFGGGGILQLKNHKVPRSA